MKIGITGGAFVIITAFCLMILPEYQKEIPQLTKSIAGGKTDEGRIDYKEKAVLKDKGESVSESDMSQGADLELMSQPELRREFAKEAKLMSQKRTRSFEVASTSHLAVAPASEMYAEDFAYRVDAQLHYEPTRDFNTEAYNRIYENEFKSVVDEALSTFSIDVDTASYSNVRRFLTQGQFPIADSVRIEELINYFSYQYPQPEGDKPFSVSIDGAVCPWNTDHQLVRIGLQGKTLLAEEIPLSNLVFLLDVSGSMNSPNKLPLLKSALKMLVNQLSANEKVAIVVYAGAAGVVLESTPGDDKQKIIAALDQLQAGGSTAGGEGIKLAYKIAKNNLIVGGNNRVILATDGDFNIGASSDAEMERLIEEKRKDGIFLTVLGFGMGNYKDSKMEIIADKGNGNYFYIDTEREAKKVLVEELGSTLFTIAKDVKIQVEFNPAKVKAFRLLGYENRILAHQDFNDDTKDAGEIGAGHTVTVLYEIVPADSQEQFQDVDDLKYQKQQIVESDDIMTVKLRYKNPDEDTSQLIEQVITEKDIAKELSGDFQFAASVAEFGMILRGSEFKADATYTHVIQLAEQSKGEDKFGYRAEFIELVKKAQGLDTRSADGAIQFKGQ
ncbi:VWA domain-containing protein [PVC group bacterium]|nr:VWA domain-containing protein [PVC group bacterium]